MTLTKQLVVDKIEALRTGTLVVHTATKIFEDGQNISESVNGYSLFPGDNLDGQDASVIAVANALWTPDVIAAYQASTAEQS